MAKNSFLLDTHIFIWWMEGNKRLSKEISELLNDRQNTIVVSVASVWEIVIKRAKNKLKIPQDIEGGIQRVGFRILPIDVTHVMQVEKLPSIHQDPFDRILIAQAKIEKCVFITDDPKIRRYNVRVIA